MNIFISHSSKNAAFGNAIVDLLTSVGISGDQIIFTSNDAYGIPIGQNIFNWLKDRITEKPFVLYLLSPEYYSSVACLNEMGAAWVVENQHAMIFTPNFDLSSYEFQNGALDPREIGFYIDNQDRLTAFIESLKSHFNVSNSPVLVNQKIRDFLTRIESLKSASLQNVKYHKKKEMIDFRERKEESPVEAEELEVNIINSTSRTSGVKFFKDFEAGKLKDEEVLLIYYVLETARYKLGTGWQESVEIENIKVWEDINQLDDTLSSNYANTLRRFEMRKLTEVSDTTSYGNPKEVMLIEEIQQELIEPSKKINDRILAVINMHPKEDIW